MKKLHACAVATITSLLFASNAAATIVHSHALTPVIGTHSDADELVYTFDRFTLGASALVNAVQWKGMYFAFGTPPAVDSFTVKFYADNAGALGAEVGAFNVGNAVNRTGTGTYFASSFEFFGYEAQLGGGIALNSGSYWISIFNETTADAGDEWYWGTDQSAQTGLVSVGTELFRSYTYDFVLLQLDSFPGPASVPEPASVALLSLGLAGLGFGRRRRSARAD